MTEAVATVEPTATEVSQQRPRTSNEERTRVRAYELYEKRNGAPGDAESDWYRAEAELRGEGAEPVR